MALRELPFDVYVQILKQLPISAQTDEAPRTLAACLRVNSILRSAASVATLWEPHYNVRYTISIPANELARKQAFGGDWKSLYMERVRLDQQAIKVLNDITMDRNARLERAREITSTLSYDVWNALATEAQCLVPEPFHTNYNDSTDGSEVPRHAIPHRFWAQSLLGAIARSHAIRTWHAIRDEEDNDTDTLEIAIACLSSYFAHPPMEISSQLDTLSDFCRSYLADRNIPTTPVEFNHSESALCRISSSICDFLWENGFRPAERELSIGFSIVALSRSATASRFIVFNTRFPHWFLSTHKDTIPISLVYIFVSIARRLGIKAAPVNFPARVLAVVSSPESTVSDIVVDVFGSRGTAILSLQEDIPRLLVDAGFSPLPVTRFIRPASTVSMVIRASRNIHASFSYFSSMENPGISEMDLNTALYTGFSVNLIFTNEYIHDLNVIMNHLSHFPLDILSVMTDALAPCLSSPVQEQLLASCKAAHESEDEAASTVMLRSNLSTSIKHFVGMIFKHAKHDYIGYIYGWELSRVTSEQRVLTCEQYHPFYHVFTQNGSVRCVAEENIIPTTLESYRYRQLFENASGAGRYFESLIQENGRARLLPSPELLSAYPEDNAVGERWIKEGMAG